MIVSGGSLDEGLALKVLQSPETAHIIGVDKGLVFLYKYRILPDVIVGDFDSLPKEILDFYKEHTQIPIREFNPVKDATDTEIALRLAVEHEWDHVLILGATGTRLDHVWGNVQILKVALDAGMDAKILDCHNRIRLFKREIYLQKKDAYGDYFSLFPLGGVVKNLNISGAKYPLKNHELVPYDSLCVSNQFDEDEVVITFSEGTVILMETKD